MNMLLCMRTTIDMPDALYRRTKAVCAHRKTTYRDLLIGAVEKELAGPRGTFTLRDASAGYSATPSRALPSDAINAAIDSLREGQPHP